MNETKKGFNFLNIVYFLIAFLIVFLIGYIIYANFIEIKGPSNIENTTNELTESQIDTLGKDKFNWMNGALIKTNNNPVFFTNTNLDSTNFDNNSLLTIAYDSLTSDDRNGSGTTDNSCFHDESGNNTTLANYPEKCYKENFDKNLLKEQIDKFFSSNIVPKYESFIPSGSKACYVNKDNNYTCILNMSDIEMANILIITGYDHAQIDSNNLIVYSKLLTVKRELDIYKKDEQGIYSDLDGNNKIDDLTYYTNTTTGGLGAESKDKLINNYKDKISTYKSTFTKDSNSNYVWISTEKIN
jgi:hypothetical protein